MANVLLGVSAGIAAYKSADLASKLTQRGDAVVTLMTPNAQKFVTPLTFRSLTRRKVYTNTFEDAPDVDTEHISLAQWADAFIIAPATADLLARLAVGMGDDIVTVTALAFLGPRVLSPSMNDQMWNNPLVQSNLRRLSEVGYRVVEPDSGHLACGSFGPGRLAPVESIIDAIDDEIARADES